MKIDAARRRFRKQSDLGIWAWQGSSVAWCVGGTAEQQLDSTAELAGLGGTDADDKAARALESRRRQGDGSAVRDLARQGRAVIGKWS
jgi:hypothetical protein